MNLILPHKTKPFLCPVNPIADICEWKTGRRIPEELLFYSHPGFTYIEDINCPVPVRALFNINMMGPTLYSSLSEIMGFEVFFDEGGEFDDTLTTVKDFVDSGIPVILFGVDMYHLAYHTRYYHNIHVFGHIVCMCGYDEGGVFLYDNSKPDIVWLSNDDLKNAWGDDFFGLCKKNAYHAINFTSTDIDIKETVSKIFRETAKEYFAPTDPNTGKKRQLEFSEDLLHFPGKYDKPTIKEIYLRIARFTGSIIPDLPSRPEERNFNSRNRHQGCRDLAAKAIYENKELFGKDYRAFEKAAALFKQSGSHIEAFTDMLCEDIISSDYENNAKYAPVLNQTAQCDSEAFSLILAQK